MLMDYINAFWVGGLLCAIGALMSPTSSQQGESIPGIAHLIHFSREKG